MSVSIAEFKPGFIATRGIFLTARELTDRKGRCAGKFYVFAAPEDFKVDSSRAKTLLTFKDTAMEMCRRESWLGHGFCKLSFERYEEQLFEGLRNGSAVGRWFIPTREMLCGKNVDGNKVWTENIYDLRDTGDLRNTFDTRGSDLARWYWSSSEHPGHPNNVWVVDFSDGDGGWSHKDCYRLSNRPVRVELAL